MEHRKPENLEAKSKPKRRRPSPSSPTLAKSRTKRRSGLERDLEEGKWAKNTKHDDVNEKGKKNADTRRIWSEEDEIVLLKGMLAYGVDGCTDKKGLLSFIKKSLHFDCKPWQLANKVMDLKIRYRKNLSRSKKELVKALARPHYRKCFDLSKKLWDETNSVQHAVKAVKKEMPIVWPVERGSKERRD